MADTVIDAATFAELQDTAGAEFVAELVGTFLEEAPQMLAELRSAQAAASADRLPPRGAFAQVQLPTPSAHCAWPRWRASWNSVACRPRPRRSTRCKPNSSAWPPRCRS